MDKLRRMCDAVGAPLQRQVDQAFTNAEQSTAWNLKTGRYQTTQDREALAAREAELKRLVAVSKHDAQKALDQINLDEAFYNGNLRKPVIEELQKDNPDPTRLKSYLDELEKSDRKQKGTKWAKARGQLLVNEVEVDKLQHMQVTPEIQRQIDSLKKMQEQLHARMGDPMITFDGRADCRRVVALMPDGTILPLTYSAATLRWEARFDIPPGTATGEYKVQIIALDAAGKRTLRDFVYTVDYTAPIARANLDWVNGRLRLRITGDLDIWRVEAILPDGARMTLVRDGSSFVAWPDATFARGDEIRFVVYDKAHNRSEVTAWVP